MLAVNDDVDANNKSSWRWPSTTMSTLKEVQRTLAVNDDVDAKGSPADAGR
jgi:hypothetical protein